MDDLERHSGCTEVGSFGTNYVTVVEDPHCLRQECRPENLVFSNT